MTFDNGVDFSGVSKDYVDGCQLCGGFKDLTYVTLLRALKARRWRRGFDYWVSRRGAMASLSDKVSLVLRWTSKRGRCLIRQSKRSCSEATTEKAISDKPSTGLRTRGSTKEQRGRDERGEQGSLRRGCDTLT